MLTALGSKEAEMKIIGCDLHAAQQTIAMLDADTGEIVEQTLKHEAGTVREFYAALPAPVVVGLEATGSMGWFLQLLDELAITYRVGHPATIRKAETRKQKHDRRDAALLLQLLVEDRFPSIGMPSSELRDLRALLLHRVGGEFPIVPHEHPNEVAFGQSARHRIRLAHPRGFTQGGSTRRRSIGRYVATFRPA